MDITGAKNALTAIRTIMDEKREFLIDLDSVMGDGDLGLTMKKAFATADDELKDSPETDIGKFFAQAGMIMAKAAPSTMGTLMATGFMRGGKAIRGKTVLEAVDVAAFFRAFADGLMERGKSQPGEKTIIDVMDPVAAELQRAADSGVAVTDLAGVLRTSRDAALEATKGMMSQHGKAAIYREQTIGKPDPGATAGGFVIEGFAATLEE